MAEGGEETDFVKELIAGSDSGCDFPCQPCCLEGPIIESSGFCVTCDEYLCDDCYRHHKKATPSRHHVLLDKDAMPRDSSSRKPVDVCTEPCQAHTGKVIEYYCPDHDRFGCSVCMTMDHKSCDYQYVPDAAQELDLDDNSEFNDLEESAASIRTRANISEKDIEKSGNVASDKLKTFKNIKQKVYERFESAEKILAKELNDITAEDASKVSQMLKKYEHALNKTETLITESKLLYKHKQMCRLFMQLKQAHRENTSIANELEKNEEDAACTEYKVIVDKHVHAVMMSADSVGKIKKSSDDKGVEKLHEYVIKHEDDKHACWITGLTLLSTHRLVAVDRTNCKVKLVDLNQNRVVSVYKLDRHGEPRDITKLSDNQIAVACNTIDSGHVVLLDIDENSDLRLNRSIAMSGRCCGLTCTKDQLVVSFTDTGKLEFLTFEDDKIVKTIEKDEDGKSLFRVPLYVHYDCRRDIIIVTNTGELNSPKSVTSLSLDGSVNAVYTDSECDTPLGLATDAFGSVYVCCRLSNNIHMLSRTLSKERVILTKDDGLHWPYAICLNEVLDEFYVGMRENDKLVAYSLP